MCWANVGDTPPQMDRLGFSAYGVIWGLAEKFIIRAKRFTFCAL